jgi:hypothetical protein
MPSHTIPGECDAEHDIVATSDVGRPRQKSLARISASSALLRSETHYAFTPGSERALEAEGTGMGCLARSHAAD